MKLYQDQFLKLLNVSDLRFSLKHLDVFSSPADKETGSSVLNFIETSAETKLPPVCQSVTAVSLRERG